MSVSSAVKNSATSSTTADIVMLASWVRPFCSSRIWVLVGLPLTTKVPVSPAAKFAPDSPTMSRLTSTLSPCFIAKLRDVAALWAMIRTKQENAIREHRRPRRPGDPLGQADRREAALHGADHRDPVRRGVGDRRHDDRQHDRDDRAGDLRENRLNPRMIASVPAANAERRQAGVGERT